MSTCSAVARNVRVTFGTKTKEEVPVVWDYLQDDLDRLRTRVSTQRSLESLQKLCLYNVVEKIEFYCKSAKDPFEVLIPFVTSHLPKLKQQQALGNLFNVNSGEDLDFFCHLVQDPFETLSAEVMLKLQCELRERGLENSPRVLPCLVSSHSESLRAEIQGCKHPWGQRDLDALLERTRIKGQVLKEVHLSFDHDCKHPQPSVPQMCAVLPSLPSLQVLDLDWTKVDDSVLAVLGANCPELRVLKLSIGEITDSGIRYLCANEAPYGNCKKLAHLDIPLCKAVTIDGLVTAMHNLPDLVHLNCDTIYQAVCKYAAMYSGRKLKLQYLHINNSKKAMKITDSLERVVRTVPDIKHLKLESGESFSAYEILKLKYITEMRFNFSISPSIMSPLIINFSNRLTYLAISFNYKNPFDISLIGYHCINLIQFIWESKFTDTFQYELQPFIHFSKLKNVRLTFNMLDCNFPDFAMKCILASTCLEDVYICGYTVSDEVLGWLIDEAREQEKVFSNLRTLSITEVKSSYRIQQIMCVAPKLRDFFTNGKIQPKVIKFLLEHNLSHCQPK